jgi:hypothetical protein
VPCTLRWITAARPGRVDTLRELVGGDPSALSGLVAEFLAETRPWPRAAGLRRPGRPRRPQPSNVAPQSGPTSRGRACP